MADFRLGIDVGSTTVKLLVLDEEGRVLCGSYERHRSDIGGTLGTMLQRATETLSLPGASLRAVVTGSAGIGIASKLGLPFVQEVIACTRAVEDRFPLADVAIELGGEDAKITYFGDRLEQRMNGSCAGGTGAFIDQMATVLGTDPAGLDLLASRATTVYPIAARCGVFSKADIQPLMNEGARREDLAASVLQAVVNQTVSGLACGRPIRGRIAFLGGPLHYLPELRRRFALTLELAPGDILVPDDGRLFVALGAAICPDDYEPVVALEELAARAALPSGPENCASRLSPLFADSEELVAFRARHSTANLPHGDPALYTDTAFLGIDAGSTTTKLALIDIDGRLLASSYRSNGGHPLSVAVDELRGIYATMAPGAHIGRVCATGYGESLVRAALRTDDGEVETVAHSKAALAIVPDADSVLDIGGQDMKFLRLKNGMVSTVLLNEACSSGCGSFLEGFAQSLGMDAERFSRAALESAAPVDLGSRCTVFMNSRVKQAQKEGASPADIAAGLAYSVIKNALHKVIKLKMASDVGKKVVVQGGTFASEAVLRAFELVSDIRPVRPVESGLMGAYGAALIARSRWKTGERSTILGAGRLGAFSYATEPRRCAGCANACLLTVTRFSSGLGEDGAHVTGNRCERGAELAVGHASNPASVEGKNADPHKPPDLFAWKYARLFRDKPLPADKAPRGRIGLPRSLNMYENYPFWSALLSSLGFSVELSPRSTKALYERGMATIPSESVCYPAKLAHGHAMALIERGVSLIFDPCIPREECFVEGSDNCFNCPIVTSYPEVLLNNIEEFRDGAAELLNPFLPIASPDRLAQRIVEEFGKFDVSPEEAKRAVEAGVAAREAYRADLRREGEAALAWIERENAHGIVLAGRPYHIDPEIHHGIPSLITGLGMAVLSEDSIAHLARVERPLRVVDQWAYHSRLYAAASLVARRGDLDLVQLVSFGCGLDAVTSDQVEEILARGGKSYAGVKIDEHSNLGAARIRLRSLAAAIAERKREAAAEEAAAATAAAATAAAVAAMPTPFSRPAFTEAMRRVRTIIAPQMSPVHFAILEKAFRLSGYKFDILPCVQGAEYARVVDEGLRSVNNDACFPSILVVGQIMNAFRSGRYDPDSTAVIITQTGGGCRATNYIAFIRKALADAGLGRIPVISLSAAGFESNAGFKITLPLVRRAIHAILYGDALMRMLYGTRPYEAEAGAADALADSWAKRCGEVLALRRPGVFRATLRAMVRDFDTLPLRTEERKPRIGVVGEILVKFHPDANGHIVDTIEAEGCEAVMPDLYDFFLYSSYNGIFRHDKLDGSRKGEWTSRLIIGFLEAFRRPMRRALRASARFSPPSRIDTLAKGVDGIVQLGNCTGEGWFLTAEMVELIHDNVDGIACLQPFACLPNHVTGKGMLKELKRRYPAVPVAAIDFDPGASEVNQLNRLKLLIAGARRGYAKRGYAKRGYARRGYVANTRSAT